MNNLIIKDNTKVEKLIYIIRDKQVMLDSDLAILYNCINGTKTINLAVKRNIERFPERFRFQLTNEEINNLRFQNETANISAKSRTNPYVFTEQGVAMLSTILRTDIAAQVSIKIMDAFVEARRIMANTHYIDRLNKVETKLIAHDININDINIKVNKLFNNFKIQNNKIFFRGQIYDANSVMIDIFNSSEDEIIIIDNYLNKTLLDIIAKTKKRIIVITNKYDNIDIEKYKKQYNNLKIKINNSFHDRFIIIDRKTLYHFGTSFKDLGKKCFTINKIEDKEYLIKILNMINF